VSELLALCEWCRRRRVTRRGARYCSHPYCQRIARLLADLRQANRHTRAALIRLQQIMDQVERRR